MNSTVRQLPQSDNSTSILMDVKDVFPGDLPAQEALESLKCIIEEPIGERTLFVLQFSSPPQNASLPHLARFVDAHSSSKDPHYAGAAPDRANQDGIPFRNYLIVAPKLDNPTEPLDPHDLVVTAMARHFNNQGFAYVASMQQQQINDDPQGVRYLPLRDGMPSFGFMTAVLVIGDPTWVTCAAHTYPEAGLFLLDLPQDRKLEGQSRMSRAAPRAAPRFQLTDIERANDCPSINPPYHRLADMKTYQTRLESARFTKPLGVKLRVVSIHDGFTGAVYAQVAAESISEAVGPGIGVAWKSWSFDMLSRLDLRHDSIHEASHADVIIVSSFACGSLPVHVRSWVTTCLQRSEYGLPVLVALHPDLLPEPEKVHPLFEFLSEAASAWQTDLLCNGDFDGQLEDGLAAELLERRKKRDGRAGCMYSAVTAESSFGWGINE